MNEQDREVKFGMLLVVTGWSEEYLKSLNDEELDRHYKERVLDR